MAQSGHSGRMESARAGRWNHNIHYHHRILNAVPVGARSALDVGTGNGLLAAELHKRVPHVTAIDPDATVLRSARTEDEGVAWICGDVMTYPFDAASFDVVACVAALHHLPSTDRALARLAELTAPGGSSGSRRCRAFNSASRLPLRRRWAHSAPFASASPQILGAFRAARVAAAAQLRRRSAQRRESFAGSSEFRWG